MAKELIELDPVEVASHFYMDGKQLFRISNDREMTDQRCVTFNGIKVITSRVIFTLVQGFSPTEYLLKNDEGDFVEVGRRVLQMFNYRRNTKTTPTQWSKHGHSDSFTAQIVTQEGQTSTRTFPTVEEAVRWQRDAIDKEWGSEFKRLGIYDSYFGAV